MKNNPSDVGLDLDVNGWMLLIANFSQENIDYIQILYCALGPTIAEKQNQPSSYP